MVLALCTGYPHTYPQLYGLVVIMYVIGHSLCYPMGYDLPSPSLAQSLHPAYAMPPPAIGAPSPLTWCWFHPPVAPVKQKGPARYANWRGCNRHYPVYNIKYLLISLLTVSHNGWCCTLDTVQRIVLVCGPHELSIGGTSRAGPRQAVICSIGNSVSPKVPAISISQDSRTHYWRKPIGARATY